MKIRMVSTGKDPVEAEIKIQQTLSEILKDGGKVKMATDSGLRVAIYYEVGQENKKAAKGVKDAKSSSDNKTRISRTVKGSSNTKSKKPKGSEGDS